MKNSSAWSMFLLSNPCKCMSPILDLIKLIAFCKIRLSLPRITLHSLFEMVIPLNFLETKTVLLGDHVLNKLFWEGHKNWAHPPHFFWHYSVTSNCKWTMGRIFVAFSEYLNFHTCYYNILALYEHQYGEEEAIFQRAICDIWALDL